MIHNDQSTAQCRFEARALEELRRETLDHTVKGLPFGSQISPARSGQERWNLLNGDLPFPLLVIKESALEQNLCQMADWCAENELLLAPHGKTTMCPQIFERQIARGAWAITVANVSQVHVCLRFGISRIFIANQVAGASNLRSLAALLNDCQELECYCLIDSVAGARHLAAGLERYGARRPVNVLLECGRYGWRTGVRSVEEGVEVWKEASLHSRFLRLRGIEAFEGLASSPEGSYEEARQVDELFDGMLRLVERLPEGWSGDGLPIFSIGGSAFLDRLLAIARQIRREFRIVVRSGCYVTHDHIHYQQKQAAALSRAAGIMRIPQFIPALELWSYVQSIPEEGLALLTFGKRDSSHDLELPKPLFAIGEGRPFNEALELAGSRIVKLNDQHAHLKLGDSEELRVGDLVCCGISHPCTAFDKWRVLPLVNDAYEVIDIYRTFF